MSSTVHPTFQPILEAIAPKEPRSLGPLKAELVQVERDGFYRYQYNIVDADGTVVAEVSQRGRGPSIARMLAASPNLLAMIEEAIELFELDDEANTPGTDAFTWLITAREVVQSAKAEAA